MIERLESRIAPASVVTIHSLASSGAGSLVDAIQHATSGEVIKLAANLHGTIAWNSAIAIDTDLTILGNGRVVLMANGTQELLAIETSGLSVTLKNLTLTGGLDGTLGGGAIFSNADLKVVGCTFTDNASTGDGGAIEENHGTLQVIGSKFLRNTVSGSSNGGAIYGDDGATISIKNSVLNSNTAGNHGGAVAVEGFDSDAVNIKISGSRFIGDAAGYGGGFSGFTDGSIKITGSLFKADTASSNIGALLVDTSSTAKIVACTITGNSADGSVGGISLSAAQSSVTDCKITHNTASNGNAGGIYVSEGATTFTNDIVTGNLAVTNGGGFYVDGGGIATLNGCTVQHNSADESGGGVAYLDGQSTFTKHGSILSQNTAPTDPNIAVLS